MPAKITKRLTLEDSTSPTLFEIVLDSGERIVCQADNALAGRFSVIVKQQQLPNPVLETQHSLQPNTPIGVCKKPGGLEFLETDQPVVLNYNTDDGQPHSVDAGQIADLHLLPITPPMR